MDENNAQQNSGSDKWLEVRGHMGEERMRAGAHLSYWFRRSPRRLLHSMAYYKFAAKMIRSGKRVLDVGCAEGLGTWLLARECGQALGVDLDCEAIASAQQNFTDERITFACQDFLQLKETGFDALTSFDVIEHVEPKEARDFLAKVVGCLTPHGIAVIGTPNIHAQQYASSISKQGHVNCYDGERLRQAMLDHFKHVFLFAANDEVVHTGYLPMAHYLLALGCGARNTS